MDTNVDIVIKHFDMNQLADRVIMRVNVTHLFPQLGPMFNDDHQVIISSVAIYFMELGLQGKVRAVLLPLPPFHKIVFTLSLQAARREWKW